MSSLTDYVTGLPVKAMVQVMVSVWSRGRVVQSDPKEQSLFFMFRSRQPSSNCTFLTKQINLKVIMADAFDSRDFMLHYYLVYVHFSLSEFVAWSDNSSIQAVWHTIL